MGNNYTEYIASTKFNIGQNKEDNLVVPKGTVVSYDGSTAVIDGREYNFPKLGSAIKSRWLVSKEELGLGGEADFKPQSAGIEMRHPTDEDGESTIASTTMVADEEREVNTIEAFKNSRHEVQSQGGDAVKGVQFKTKAGKAAMEESVSVDRLSQNAIQQMEKGTERHDKLAQFQALENQKMEREIADLKKQLASQQPKKQVREGIQFNTAEGQVGTGTTKQASSEYAEGIWDGQDAPVVGSTNEQQATGQESTASDFDVQDKEARLKMARQMMPSFDWDFEQHWKTKLKTLNDDGRPLYVCAVYAVESDAMKKHIAKQFPEMELG